jgi:ribosomal protein S18 acetylase RimI-like enzyme
MDEIRIVDIVDAAGFGLLPPCADPSFDHRTCDYWEDAGRGSRAHRPAWLKAAAPPAAPRPRPVNPFAPDEDEAPANPFAPAHPFAPAPRSPAANPFALDEDDDPLSGNPFAPRRPSRPAGPGADAPRKLALLSRGLAVFGSYAKVLLVRSGGEERAVAYVQFGPLSAYPRALRVRELYPQLPATPLPAVVTCVATTSDARSGGHARRLVRAVCDDLAGRGFAAVEAYPEAGARPDATSAATPAFWIRAGFRVAIDDERFPVVRRELG